MHESDKRAYISLTYEAMQCLQREFDRDSLAVWYAREHLGTDPGIVSVYYLPQNADEREIRFVEVNKLLGDRNDDALEPIDFGVDMGTDNARDEFSS